MCLRVDQKIRNNHHKENDYCVAYKVIRHNNSTLFARINNFLYKVGENIPYEPSCVVDFNKKYHGDCVEYGLHLFLDKITAKGLVSYNKLMGYNSPGDMKIIKVYYKPEDVIAYGISNVFNRLSADREKSVVVRKLTIKSLDPIK